MVKTFFFCLLSLLSCTLFAESESYTLVFSRDKDLRLYKTVVDPEEHPLLTQTTCFSLEEGVFLDLFWIEPTMDSQGIPRGEPTFSLPISPSFTETALFAPLGDWLSRGGKAENAPVAIELPLKALADESPILCSGSVGESRFTCLVSCGFWNRLHLDAEDAEASSINLLKHLPELLPSSGRTIGLLTYQNGINTTLGEFYDAFCAIRAKIPEGTLLLGLYNKTKGLAKDVLRLLREIILNRTASVEKMESFLSEIATSLHEINPDSLWGHVLHSEGGVIMKRAIEDLTRDKQDLLKQHLYLFALGSVVPIPESYAYRALNIYSREDFICLASQLLGIGGYSLVYSLFGPEICRIQFLPSLSKRKDKTLFLIDHAFQGKTYRTALEKQLENWRELYGFYSGTLE